MPDMKPVVGVWREVVERLTPVPLADRKRFLDFPPTREAHADAHSQVGAFYQIELRQPASVPPSKPTVRPTVRIAAWNLERCLYPEEAAQTLQRNHVDIALLTEMVLNINSPLGVSEERQQSGARWVDPNVKAAQRSLETVLGMRVRIRDRKGKGKITIEYGTLEDFDRVVGMLKGK